MAAAAFLCMERGTIHVHVDPTPHMNSFIEAHSIFLSVQPPSSVMVDLGRLFSVVPVFFAPKIYVVSYFWRP